MSSVPENDQIESLGLSRRTYNTLMRAGIHRVSELTSMTDTELLSIHNLGVTVLNEIRTKIMFQQELPFQETPIVLTSSEQQGTANLIVPNDLAQLPLDVLGLYSGLSKILKWAGVLTVIDIEKLLRNFHISHEIPIDGLGLKSIAYLEKEFDRYIKEHAQPNQPTISGNLLTHEAPSERAGLQSQVDVQQIPIRALDLPVRVYNALARDGINSVWDVIAVIDRFHETNEILIRNLGPKGVGELEQALEKYLNAPKSVSPQRPTYLETSASGTPLIITKSHDAPALNSDSNQLFGERLHKLKLLLADEIKHDRLHNQAQHHGITISAWINRLESESGSVTRAKCTSLERALSSKTVADELLDLCSGIRFERLDIFVYRLGPQKQTLEELGQQRNLTRERIRQLTQHMKKEINHRMTTSSCLRIQSALAIAADMGKTITYLDWVRRITKSGLLGEWSAEVSKLIPSSVTPLGLLVAVCNPNMLSLSKPMYPLPENLNLVVHKSNVSPADIELISNLPTEKIRALRRQSKNGGAINVTTMARELSLSAPDTRSVLVSIGYRRITDEWYMLPFPENCNHADKQWAAFHTILKILHFCGPLDIKDIHGGLRKHVSRLGFIVPPPSILEKVVTEYGFEMENGRVIWPKENLSTAHSGERIMLEEIRRIGPVVTHFELVQAFLRSGLSVPMLSSTLRYSPLFSKVDLGLYKLRGAAITQGDVEQARSRQISIDSDPEISFNPSGIITLRLNLGHVTITSGVLYASRLPSLSGKWTARVDATECGKITVRDKIIWGLAKSIRALKVEVGNRISLQFNPWSRSVDMAKVANETQ